MRILLITPPLVQPNAPYSATPVLCAWLRSRGHQTFQSDLSLELLLRLFSREGVRELVAELRKADFSGDGNWFLDAPARYEECVESVVALLQGRSSRLVPQLVERGFLPEGPHLLAAYDQEDRLGWAFAGLNELELAKHLGSLFLDDLSEAARLADSRFAFSRYAEGLVTSSPEFSPLQSALENGASLCDRWLDELTDLTIRDKRPEMVALTVPFPGCLYGALRIARRIKQISPEPDLVLGGGYVSTELRNLSDPAIFQYLDYLILDDGMRPLESLAEKREPGNSFVCREGQVTFLKARNSPPSHDTIPAPCYDGLDPERYFGLLETLNPAMSIWSDSWWNRLTLAYGCYWQRCAFCDTHIEQVNRYDPASATTVCDWMESLMEQTGSNAFHFVDESMPPNLLDPLCDEILRRDLEIEWWGNLRLERTVSSELIRKMADAGAIAVTCGLETCSERTLEMMEKGISLRDAKRIFSDLAEAGILVHAYLMYGFPTQTLQETISALEFVRQSMEQGVLDSVFWHRFALSDHSAIADNPERFGIVVPQLPPAHFARNEIPFQASCDHNLDEVGKILQTATYNYNLGVGLHAPAQEWFRSLGEGQ